MSITSWRKIVSHALVPPLAVCIGTVMLSSAHSAEFRSSWPADTERTWVGPEYWANRLQDWKLSGGRLVCVEGRAEKPMRTVHLLTRRLGVKRGGFETSVSLGLTGAADAVDGKAAAGFLVGAGPELDYRAAALVHHSPGPGGGLFAGIDATGALFISDFGDAVPADGGRSRRFRARMLVRKEGVVDAPKHVDLALSVKPAAGSYSMTLTCSDPASGNELGSVTLDGIHPSRVRGNLALVSHPGENKGNGRFWFADWRISGDKVEKHDDRHCGPILSTRYTLHDHILKMTAQMMPVGERDAGTVKLELRENGRWAPAAEADIVVPGFTATFRVEGWDPRRDVLYRVVYDLRRPGGPSDRYFLYGTVRREPADKPEIVVAGFTGNHNVRRGGVERAPFEWNPEGVWFPHCDIVAHVAALEPDVLFFSGDQVYEGASPTRADREKPYLDYLYKWYLWCWAFRDLCQDIPSVVIPDDHDVYHGNVWGAGGRHAETQDDGGYTMPPEFVNMVQRTQTSHLPDPYDPTPVEQGITVYYTAMNYGGVSFAILEDRKFKSSPTVMIPEAEIVNGWAQNPDFDPVTQADVPGAKLLGERQLEFLNHWASDWSGGVWMKVVLSQTLFANVATLPRTDTSDKVVPSLKRLKPGEYPESDEPVADADSNGWPQSGRNRALREMRRGFAFHLCGDQHLGSTVQYGIDDWNDAGYAFCVPSIANFFPRRWYPSKPGRNRKPGAPRYTGEYRDGFGNHVTVHAVSNPVVTGRHPLLLHDKAPGYGIVRLNRESRTITIECWPRWVDPAAPDAEQYPGWPITIDQLDNYGRKAAAYLPEIRVAGMTDPVVQVIDEADGEIVYTIRIRGNSFRPKVFREGSYTVGVGEPGTERWKTMKGVRAPAAGGDAVIKVDFR